MDVRLAPVPAYDTFWQNPIDVDPFDVPLEDKVALADGDLARAQEEPRASCSASRSRASSASGSSWRRARARSSSRSSSTRRARRSATARHERQVKTRTFSPSSAAKGYEHFSKARLLEHAERDRGRSRRARDGGAGGQWPQGPDPAAVAPAADDPRDHRAPDRARSRRRLRGQLRRHELHHAEGSREAEVRIDAVQRGRRSHLSRRDGHRRATTTTA